MIKQLNLLLSWRRWNCCERGTGTIQVPTFGGTSGKLFTRYRVQQPDNLYTKQKSGEGESESDDEGDMEGWAEWSATGLPGTFRKFMQLAKITIADLKLKVIDSHRQNQEPVCTT